MSEKIVVMPNIILYDKHILIGYLLGFNSARKRLEESPKPIFNNRDLSEDDFFIGYLLELTCAKCGRLHTFNDFVEIPIENYECQSEDCDNIIILYGVDDVAKWRVGNIPIS